MPGFLARLFGSRPVTVEPAGPRDVRRLAELHGAAFHRCLLYTSDAADEAEILSIAIDARHRGRGLSRDLLLTHLGHLAGRGVTRVFLEVEENNQPARRLYERAGFTRRGPFADYPDAPLSVFMEKTLAT